MHTTVLVVVDSSTNPCVSLCLFWGGSPSQAGGGNWGQSDEVVVKARNSVVVAETERAMGEGCRKIMIMYGGLHMQV